MKRIILVVSLLVAVLAVNMTVQAQSPVQDVKKEAKKAAKEAKKLEEKMRDQIKYKEAVYALESQKFVLEADRVVFKRGRTSSVTSNTNFVALEDGYATVQVAFNTAYSGANGLGGVTVEGQASNIEMKTDKKGNVNFSMNIMGVRVSAKISIDLYQGSNAASVMVLPSFNSNRITLSGILLPFERSNVFKGRSL